MYVYIIYILLRDVPVVKTISPVVGTIILTPLKICCVLLGYVQCLATTARPLRRAGRPLGRFATLC